MVFILRIILHKLTTSRNTPYERTFLISIFAALSQKKVNIKLQIHSVEKQKMFVELIILGLVESGTTPNFTSKETDFS